MNHEDWMEKLWIDTWGQAVADAKKTVPQFYTHVRKVDLTVFPHKTSIAAAGSAVSPPGFYNRVKVAASQNTPPAPQATCIHALSCVHCGTASSVEWPCDAQGNRVKILNGSGNPASWCCKACLYRGVVVHNHGVFATDVDANATVGRIYCPDCNVIYWDAYADPQFITNIAALLQPIGSVAPSVGGFSAKVAKGPIHISVKPTCTKCRRALSSTLDAYYGKDPEMAKRCSSCR